MVVGRCYISYLKHYMIVLEYVIGVFFESYVHLLGLVFKSSFVVAVPKIG